MYLSKLISVLALFLIVGACELPKTPNTDNQTPNANKNASPTPMPTPSVTINDPTEKKKDKKVAGSEVITGTSQNIPADQKIWIVIFNHASTRFYPQDRAADAQANGDWASATAFGVPADKGKNIQFDIVAVTVDKNGEAEFEKYLNTARASNSFPGLKDLPKGASIRARLTVTRE